MTYLDGWYAFLSMWRRWAMDSIYLWQPNQMEKRVRSWNCTDRICELLFLVILQFDGLFSTSSFNYCCHHNIHTAATNLLELLWLISVNFGIRWPSQYSLFPIYSVAGSSIETFYEWAGGSWIKLIASVCLRASINESEINTNGGHFNGEKTPHCNACKIHRKWLFPFKLSS